MNLQERISFKPYYKWITFNTIWTDGRTQTDTTSFKPYYKWITFNTITNKKYIGGIKL